MLVLLVEVIVGFFVGIGINMPLVDEKLAMPVQRNWGKSSGNVVSIATTYTDCGSAYVVPSSVSKAGIVIDTKETQLWSVCWTREEEEEDGDEGDTRRNNEKCGCTITDDRREVLVTLLLGTRVHPHDERHIGKQRKVGRSAAAPDRTRAAAALLARRPIQGSRQDRASERGSTEQRRRGRNNKRPKNFTGRAAAS